VVKVLICAPDGWGDPATDYWCPYEAIWFARLVRERGAEPLVLRRSDCVKEAYDRAVSECDVVTGVGHGSETTFTGYRLAILEQCPVPAGKYDGRGWFPVSCLVGVKLAPEIVEKSASAAAIGEVTLYWFWVDPRAPHRGEDPEREDPYLASFLIPEKDFRLAVLEGRTLRESHEVMLASYEEQARKWEQRGFREIADTLRYDAANRRRFGDDNWRIREAPPPPPPQCDYTCPLCGFEARNAEELAHHVLEAHCTPRVTYTCPFCSFEAESRDQLRAHVLAAHLQPCKLRGWLRRRLGCPIERL